MKSSNSFTKDKDKEKENERYTSGEESFLNLNPKEKNGKRNKKLLGKINKSYSTLTTDVNNDRKSSKKTDSDEFDRMQTSFRLNDKIDYAKKIKEAKEMEDLKKIYEKWRGERYDSSNKKKNDEDEEYIWVKKKKNKNEEYKNKFNIMNVRYKNMIIENRRMKEELKKMKLELNKLNKSKEELKTKKKNLNFRNNNLILKKKKSDNELDRARKLIEDEEIKEQLRKLLEEQNNKKNDLIDIIKNKNAKNINLYGPKVGNENDINKNKKIMPKIVNDKNKKVIVKNKTPKIIEIKNKSFVLDQNKIKTELNKKNKIINENNKKIEENKEKEKNDKLLLEKLKKDQSEMTKKLNEKKKIVKNEIKLENNDDQKIKYKLKLNTKKIIKPYKSIKDLKLLLKKLNSFSDDIEDSDILIEELEAILELNKYLQNEISINKNDNLMLPEKAVYYTENVIIRFLGYFGSELALRGMKTYIEKIPTNYPLRETTFKIVSSNLGSHKVYRLVIDNEEYKKSNEAYINFLEDIKTKISNKFYVSENDIYFFGNDLKNYEIYLIVYNKDIGELENYLKELDIKVTKTPLLSNVILSSNIFDIKFSKDENDWPKNNLIRGGKKYYPPYGWLGIAFKLKNRYGKKNNIWFGKENNEGEWPVAYHGIGLGKGNVFKRILNIINGNLKDEVGKLFKNETNIEKDNAKYPYCGEGIYFSPNIEDAALFADKTSLGFFNVKFQFAFMARINPNKIRSPDTAPVQWILSDSTDEIRPYRLLIKFIPV